MALSVTLYVMLLWCTLTHTDAKPAVMRFMITAGNIKVKPLPAPDGNLNVYSLPVGQGDSHVIQCPDGTLTLFDMGSNEYDPDNLYHNYRFLTPPEIKGFFGTQQNRIHNVIITHNHYDHYSLLVRTFDQAGDISALENIYTSCTVDDMAPQIKEWVHAMNLCNKVRTLNEGQPCGPNGIDCGSVDLCPNDDDVISWFMAANLGQHCSDGGNINMNSIVLKLERANTSILMTGDFEDETSDEDGQQKLMADFYGERLQSTIFALSHHGASRLANKRVFRDAVAPKSVFVSANTAYRYHHPRCAVLDGFIHLTGSLCQPNVQKGDEFYCGDNPLQEVPPELRVQPVYTCGLSSDDDDNKCQDQICLRRSNNLAIYTTTPDGSTINLVQLSVAPNGDWGFQTNYEITIKF